MKHSAEKIVALILAVCLCAALTGCGRDGETNATEALTATEATEAATESETTKKTDEAKDDGIVNDVTNGTDTEDADHLAEDTENGAEEIGEGIGEVGDGIVDGAEDIVDGVTDETAADNNTAADNP